MRLSPFELGSAALLAAAVGVSAAGLAAQERPMVSSEVAVARGEATLVLEFSDGGSLVVTFEDGEIFLDGVVVGEFEAGEALEDSWRGLLGQAISLRDEALADALVAWAPPEGLNEPSARAGATIDQALEDALRPPAPADETADAPAVDPREGTSLTLGSLLALVEGRESLLAALDGADLRITLGEDVVIEAGESVDGGLVVVGGNLNVYGTVEGDAVVVGGTVHLYDGGRVEGDLHLADSQFFRDGGQVMGTVSTLEPRGDPVPGALDREDLRREIREAVAPRAPRSHSFWSPFRNIGEGVAGLFRNLITLGLLALAGLGMIYFLPDRLEVIADTIQQAPARSAAVGVASGFLLLPAYVLGMVVLAVSIVGIPVLLAWIPLFPILALLAAAVGYAAVARNLGRWIAERDIQGTDWVQSHSSFSMLLGGIGALLLPFIAGNVIHMAGDWLGFLESLLTVFGIMATVAAVMVGFGAVVLTRGGRRSGFADGVDFDFDLPDWTPRRPWREAWQTARGMDRDSDAGKDSGAEAGPTEDTETNDA